jgi:hypothetical protein
MGMKKQKGMNRRVFFGLLATGSAAAVSVPGLSLPRPKQEEPREEKPATNSADALKHPRKVSSMPGPFPGKVVQVNNKQSLVDNQFNQEVIDGMIANAMLELTGAKTLKKAWRSLFSPSDRIGLKVNPVAGRQLSTSHEVTRSVIRQLEEAGIPRGNITIWDRREFQLHETGFTEQNYPGIRIMGTEKKDDKDSFYNQEGLLYSEEMIDKDWYYWADVEGEYDAYTLPYMVNEGKYSYFSRICTQELDKIINIPILKNAGSSVTLCLKNLAYGALTNTGRLHKDLWSETSAEACAFPPLRDKVVLNIVDGIRGCYQGGPAANPQFFVDYQTVLVGTDPVAVDRVGYDIVIRERIKMGIQEGDTPKGQAFIAMAEDLGLGIGDKEKVNHVVINQDNFSG